MIRISAISPLNKAKRLRSYLWRRTLTLIPLTTIITTKPVIPCGWRVFAVCRGTVRCYREVSTTLLPNLDFAWIFELNQQLYFGKNLIYNKWKVERGGLHVRITEADISMQKAIS